MEPLHSSHSASAGYIVLAAYQPDEVLFGRQLSSIRAQTVADFRCLIVADGGPEAVAGLVRRLAAGDDRFEVIGASERVGFYRNFERGLAAVPSSAAWVALSDQDDCWYPDKLERMLPHLAEVAIVGGQARVVEHPSGRVIAASTNRRDAGAVELVVCNQFTGGMTLFRRELLDHALPFPDFPSPAQVHDHWLAVSASCNGGTRVISDIVQDYVQHGANALGEAAGDGGVAQAWRNLRNRADADAGGRVRSLARSAYVVNAGWAEAMVDALAQREPADSSGASRLRLLFGPDMSWWRTAIVLARVVVRRRLALRNALVHLVGAALRPLARR